MSEVIRAPFPWFGGKSRVAHVVWDRFGNVANYVEPFAGSLAVLLGRPHEPRIETVNDIDCYLANFWRAVRADPDAVVAYADWPVNEADLHARHQWLVGREEFRERMKTDPEYFDAKVAGWWVWGICQWIGGGWCSNPEWRGRVGFGSPRGIATATERRRPSLSSPGRYLERKRVTLGKGGHGVHRRQIPDISGDSGAAGRGIHAKGLHRKLPKMDGGTASRLLPEDSSALRAWFQALAGRLRRVRVGCGDWRRVLGPSPTVHIGTTAVFLDPPYAHDAGRDTALYAAESADVSVEVREWAIANGDNPKLRIALCGYEGEHKLPDSWRVVAWRSQGGYGSQSDGPGRTNRERERIWFSPHCLGVGLFERENARGTA